jgi:hypothetical protein
MALTLVAYTFFVRGLLHMLSAPPLVNVAQKQHTSSLFR